MWWTYFVIPWGEVLDRHRERASAFAAGHYVIFSSIAATGAGMHVGAYLLEGVATISTTQTVVAVAVPVGAYLFSLYAIYAAFTRHRDPFHLVLVAATAAVLVLAVACAQVGLSMAWCLVVLMLAPAVTVVGYEVLGHRHLSEVMRAA